MSLRTRLAAIERHIKELHADHDDRCPTCGGSGPGESRIVRCPKLACPACGGVVDEHGQGTRSTRRVGHGEEVHIARVVRA